MDPSSSNFQPRKLIIGSRNSQLAVIQANHIVSLVQDANPKLKIEVVTMATIGDKILDKSLSKLSERTAFTKELEEALEEGEIDAIVHSLKDLPASLPPRLCIGAVSKRELPYDVFIARKDSGVSCLAELPDGSIVGSSSPRRIAEITRAYPKIICRSIRGNLNTRLAKLDNPENNFSGIILAAAGVKRLGWEDRITEVLDDDICYYAASQGALGVEIRRSDDAIASLFHRVCDEESIIRCICERAFVGTLSGGSSAAVGVKTSYDTNKKDLKIQGKVLSYDGARLVEDKLETNILSFNDTVDCALTDFKISAVPLNLQKAAFCLGTSLANILLHNGADSLLKEAKMKNLEDVN